MLTSGLQARRVLPLLQVLQSREAVGQPGAGAGGLVTRAAAAGGPRLGRRALGHAGPGAVLGVPLEARRGLEAGRGR